MRKAIQFGAGNIGRGFLGQLLSQSSFEIVFIDISNELVNLINQEKKYIIEIADSKKSQIEVTNIKAIHFSSSYEIIKEILEADLLISAVGVKAVSEIIPLISKGIIQRAILKIKKPINIIICENMYESAKFFKNAINKNIPKKFKHYFNQKVGFVEAVIGRMIPILSEAEKKKSPLLIRAEKYCILPVDKSGFKGKAFRIKNMVLCKNFLGYIERKLYMHNTSHAICAYLGWLKKYKYIYQAIRDREIRKIVLLALDEATRVLVKRDKITLQTHKRYINDLINRYNNKFLKDTIERVAKDPIRKLAVNDRLIGIAKLCLKYKIEPINISIGIAAALNYFNENDKEAKILNCRLNKEGLEKILNDICKIKKSDKLYPFIIQSLEIIKNRFLKKY